MFDRLVGSDGRCERFRGTVPGSMASLVIHGALLYGAIVGTVGAGDQVPAPEQDTISVVIPLAPDEPRPSEDPPLLTTLVPGPQGFRTVDLVVVVPDEIPPVDLNDRWDPQDYTGRGVEGGTWDGVPGAKGPVPVSLDQVFATAAVDEAPVLLSGPPPRYPPLLRDAGIEGDVVVEVVIGEDGRPEAETLRVVSSTNRSFERAARDAVLGSVFRPGRLRGMPVRVLVSVPVRFRIAR